MVIAVVLQAVVVAKSGVEHDVIVVVYVVKDPLVLAAEVVCGATADVLVTVAVTNTLPEVVVIILPVEVVEFELVEPIELLITDRVLELDNC